MNRREFLHTMAIAGAGSLAASACGRVAPVVLGPGRQLLVDDHLIAHTDLARTFHLARYLDVNPVLVPDRPWEDAGTATACAMPFGDAVLFDPRDRLFKLWYLAGLKSRHTCLAVSRDLVEWDKPDWGVVPGTNIVWPYDPVHGRDSHTVVRDPFDTDLPYKMQSSGSGTLTPRQWLLGSRDGVHWSRLHETPPTGDRTTMYYDPFRRRWVFSLRAGGEAAASPRRRQYLASDTFVPKEWRPVEWPSTSADAQDPFPAGVNGNPPQLYCLDATPYESLMLGLFTIFRGDVNDRPKLNDICVGFSRDGFTWQRPDRRPFIGLGEAGGWNYGNVQPAGGGCVVVGDRLLFVVSGRAGIPGTSESGVCSTGVAWLRRDGFASLEGTGSMTTRPLVFEGRHLFVNADVQGELRVEMLDDAGNAVSPSSRSASVTGDRTRHRVTFADFPEISASAARPLRFKFLLDRGRLFSFWISATPDGRSGGYLAAGGPDGNHEGRDAAD